MKCNYASVATITSQHPTTNQRVHALPGVSELRHFSFLAWPVSVPRARMVLPAAAGPIDGGEIWATVASHLDTGTRSIGGDGQGGFEQTDYRLHYRRSGEGRSWLIGTSIGSLSAVSARHYWSHPWHLGAMEFQLSYDERSGRYRDYRLQTESQWVSSRWEIEDSGIEATESMFELGLPGWVGTMTSDHYLRRDGLTGVNRMLWFDNYGTTGRLITGRCDLLEGLGLLTAEEIQRPALVRLYRRLGVRFEAAAMMNRSLSVGKGSDLAWCA